MKNKIQQICKDLEKQNDIKIIFAVESGSRLWRIDSKNSDYDVRFVFVRPIDDYLRINKLKDVIEYNGENIDVVGFDLYKYSKLLMTSNPTVIEWLLSDIVYYGKQPKELLTFIHKNFNPAAIFYHYISMCKQNYLKYIKSKNKITYKKYLYAMRGLLNALWVKKLKEIPPINFNINLQQRELLPEKIRERLLKIIALKKNGKEEEIVENSKIFDNFIEKQLKTLEAPTSKKLKDQNMLDKIILRILST